ncbi:hypothetical protein MKL09_08545 [Methylobacterium sp. J-048]|uniref:hypothetical protein n=1 Tax=Methylobacterium sp. J-048 TaxID=2836635 RepID=UPI001FBA9DDF|nr:hypothetical protein [Methylobacterium sp. J-048]MCJ2056602.1 hypothetical protein [Methylobacterium sp. J-048]
MASTRRAALGALLALPAASLPALAATHGELPEREAQFLALAPRILPLVEALKSTWQEAHRLYTAAEDEAGTFPGYDDEKMRRAWVHRAKAARDANGYSDAWGVFNATDVALTQVVNGFDEVEMTTLPAILLKAMLVDLGDWWKDSVVADLQRYAEAQLCA